MVPVTSYTTIQSMLKYIKQSDFSYDKLFLKSLVPHNDNSLIVNSSSLYTKYYDYIKRTIIKINLSDKEYIKYRFQPKLFCYDIYGTAELWGLLLLINNYTSILQFNNKSLYVFGPNIFETLNEIMINEDKEIRENKHSVGL